MLQLQDMLGMADLEPGFVNVMLHSPRERDLALVMPSLVHDRSGAFEAFQALHIQGAQAALKQGRPFFAVFVKARTAPQAGRFRMLFCGIYANNGWRDRCYRDKLLDPEIRFLRDRFGYLAGTVDPAMSHAWFDLSLTERLAELRGRLVVSVRLTPNYVRLTKTSKHRFWRFSNRASSTPRRRRGEPLSYPPHLFARCPLVGPFNCASGAASTSSSMKATARATSGPPMERTIFLGVGKPMSQVRQVLPPNFETAIRRIFASPFLRGSRRICHPKRSLHWNSPGWPAYTRANMV